MTELECLRNSLVLTETDPSKIESIFKDIAKNLLNNFVIRKGDELYRMVEIEFYYYYCPLNTTIPIPTHCNRVVGILLCT